MASVISVASGITIGIIIASAYASGNFSISLLLVSSVVLFFASSFSKIS